MTRMRFLSWIDALIGVPIFFLAGFPTSRFLNRPLGYIASSYVGYLVGILASAGILFGLTTFRRWRYVKRMARCNVTDDEIGPEELRRLLS